MKILVVSATEKEINLVSQKIVGFHKTGNGLSSGNIGNAKIDFLISGVGLPSTIFRLTSLLCKGKYDMVINLGVAGSYNENFKIGDVVCLATEQFGDIGINDNGELLTLFEMGYVDRGNAPFTNGKLCCPVSNLKYKTLVKLPIVNGLTVNLVSGNESDIEKRKSKFSADIESMEGAGVFYVCLLQEVHFIEIRAVSNKVEPRNLKNWNMPLAIMNLGKTTIDLLEELSVL
jgi:futalosine hydrolase